MNLKIPLQTQIGREFVLLQIERPVPESLQKQFPQFNESDVKILNATVYWTPEIRSRWGIEIGKKKIDKIVVHTVFDGEPMDLNFTSENAEIKVDHNANEPSRTMIAPIELSVKILKNKNQISVIF
tara:strand:+ start:1136 stop:1513 length:378 start_codon:yes stop_codon:yes gene_type:complete